MNARAFKLVTTHSAPRIMSAPTGMAGEAHAIADRIKAIARKVEGQTTDAAIADARRDLAALSVRVMKLSVVR